MQVGIYYQKLLTVACSLIVAIVISGIKATVKLFIFYKDCGLNFLHVHLGEISNIRGLLGCSSRGYFRTVAVVIPHKMEGPRITGMLQNALHTACGTT